MENNFLAIITYGAPCSTDHKHKYSEIDFEEFLDNLGEGVVDGYEKKRSDKNQFVSEYEIKGDKEKIIESWRKKSGEGYDEPNYLWGYCLSVDGEYYELNYD